MMSILYSVSLAVDKKTMLLNTELGVHIVPIVYDCRHVSRAGSTIIDLIAFSEPKILSGMSSNTTCIVSVVALLTK